MQSISSSSPSSLLATLGTSNSCWSSRLRKKIMMLKAVVTGSCALLVLHTLSTSQNQFAPNFYRTRQLTGSRFGDAKILLVSSSSSSSELPPALKAPLHRRVMTEPECSTRRMLCNSSDAPTGIIYLNNGRDAGLRDIRSVAQQLANLAAPLCAKVYMPSPSKKLRYMAHNHGVPLPDTLKWNDYMVLQDMSHDSNDAHDDGIILNLSNEEFVASTANATHVVLDRTYGPSVMEQYKKVISMAREGERFVWEIKSNVYDWRDPFAALFDEQDEAFPAPFLNNGHGCHHVKWRDSVLQKEAMHRFFNRLNTTQAFTSLHIRRGDNIQECDSSIETLGTFLNCSYASCRAEKRLPVVLFTDEENSTYIEQVKDIVEQHTSTMVHGDALLQQVIKSLGGHRANVKDNFFLFGVADLIMKKATSSLVRHRNDCSSCKQLCEKD